MASTEPIKGGGGIPVGKLMLGAMIAGGPDGDDEPSLSDAPFDRPALPEPQSELPDPSNVPQELTDPNVNMANQTPNMDSNFLPSVMAQASIPWNRRLFNQLCRLGRAVWGYKEGLGIVIAAYNGLSWVWSVYPGEEVGEIEDVMIAEDTQGGEYRLFYPDGTVETAQQQDDAMDEFLAKEGKSLEEIVEEMNEEYVQEQLRIALDDNDPPYQPLLAPPYPPFDPASFDMRSPAPEPIILRPDYMYPDPDDPVETMTADGDPTLNPTQMQVRSDPDPDNDPFPVVLKDEEEDYMPKVQDVPKYKKTLLRMPRYIDKELRSNAIKLKISSNFQTFWTFLVVAGFLFRSYMKNGVK